MCIVFIFLISNSMVHKEIFLNVLYEGKNDLGIPLEHLKVA